MEAVPPNQMEVTTWDKLRKRQIVHMAKAYGVNLPNPDATKTQLIPFMQAAESNGAFRQKPVNPRYLAMAMHPDEPDRWPEEAESVEVADFKQLQALAREKGINSFGKSAEQLRAELGDAVA
jgi:hypothetical protein